MLALALVLALPTLTGAQYVPRALQESDGSPKLPDANAVEIDQSTGLQLQQMSGSRGKIKLATTAVTAGTYGGAASCPQFTVDVQGRLTAASGVALDLAACSTGQYMTDITSGAPVCAPVAFSQLSGQVSDTQIADGAVDGGTDGEIADDSITAADLAAGAVGTSEAAALDTADVTTGTWPAARGGLGQAQPTCAGTTKLTCDGTICSCGTDQDSGGDITAVGTCASGACTLVDADVPDSITIDSANAVEGTDLGTLTDTKACTYDLAGTEIDCATTLFGAGDVPAAETDAAHDTCAEISGCVVGALTVEVDGSTTNELQNMFQTVDATSGTDPVADSTTDTLTITGGTGVTVTGDSGTDTVTIAATLGTAVDLVAEVGSTILPVANGGTGTASTLTGLMRGSASAMTAGELSGDVTTSGSHAVTIGADKITSGMVAFPYAGSSSEGGAATTALALNGDPTDCSTSTHFAVGVTAAGVATCEAIADGDIPSTITRDNGDAYTGTHDFGGAQLELPNTASACVAADCDAAGEVGRVCVVSTGVTATAAAGQQVYTCTDFGATHCFGGANDGATPCGNNSMCPSGTCYQYRWTLPSFRVANVGVSPGLRTEKEEFSADFTVSGVNGVTTIAPGPSFRMDGEVIASGEIPVNLQPTSTLKTFGGTPNVEAGYQPTPKVCVGGTNAGATSCTVDSECPGSTCEAAFVIRGLDTAHPVYMPGGVALGTHPISTENLSTNTRTKQWAWGFTPEGTADLLGYTLRPIFANKARAVTVSKVCCYSDVTGVTVTGVAKGGGTSNFATPIPTPALPTPAACATPGWYLVDSGCVTGQAFSVPINAEIQQTYSAVSGNKSVRTVLVYTAVED